MILYDDHRIPSHSDGWFKVVVPPTVVDSISVFLTISRVLHVAIGCTSVGNPAFVEALPSF